MSRFAIRALACAATLALAVGGASAVEAGEALGGVYAHGVGVKQSQEGGADFLLGYRTDSIQNWTWIAKPSIHLIVAGNTNVPTDFIALGLDWRINLTHSHKWYVRPGIGFAYTTGKADIGNPYAPGLTPEQKQDRQHQHDTRIDFGSKDLFEPELALGYQVTPRLAAELSYVHLSNGQILHHGVNQGLDDVGLRLAYRY